MTTSAPGTNRRSKVVVLAATAALMLSLLPFASVFAGVPSVSSVSRTSATPTTAGSVAWTVTFSESVNGVDPTDFTVAATGTATGAVPTVSPGPSATYTVSVASVVGDGTLCLNVVDDNSILSVSTAEQLATTFTCTETYAVDNTDPAAASINRASASPTSLTSVSWTATFSESVSGVDASDFALVPVTVSGASITGVTGSGISWTVTASTGSGSGSLGLNLVDNDSIVDAVLQPLGGVGAANGNLTGQAYTINDSPPTVTVDRASGQADPTGTSPIVFSVVFSENVTGFTSGDISFTGSTVGGTLVASVSGSGSSYTVSVTGMTAGSGNVVIVVATGAASDVGANPSAAPTNTDNSIAWDTTPGPTVTINQASGQADPTGTSPINFTVVFSAPVTGFTGSDVVISGTASGTKTVTVTGAGPTYTAAVSGMTGSGTVIATIPAGAALSTAGNHPTQASTSTDNTVTFGLTSKYIVTSSNSSPTPGAAVTITAQLVDAANVAVLTSGVVVTWSKTGTGGTFSSATSTTNASGIATVTFTVGTTLGTIHTVTATSPGGITGTSGNITVSLVSATLTISSNFSITTYRQYINLSAQFSGTGGANRVVSFQRLTPVVPGTWVTISTATTNAAGRASFSYGPPYNTQFRAVFAGATDLAAITSNTIKVNVRHKVLLRPGASTTTFVRPGTRITYTATVRPIAPAGLQRVTFLIFKRVNGVWTFRTSATVATSAGVASFSWHWSRGEWYVRARGNATIYNLAAYSTLSKVTAR